MENNSAVTLASDRPTDRQCNRTVICFLHHNFFICTIPIDDFSFCIFFKANVCYSYEKTGIGDQQVFQCKVRLNGEDFTSSPQFSKRAAKMEATEKALEAMRKKQTVQGIEEDTVMG